MGSRHLELSQGRVAQVDEADYEAMARHKWYLSAYGYAARGVTVNGRRTLAYMHRVLMEAPPGLDVDHIDGDRTNNCRANLRLATRADNLKNSKPRPGGTSKHKGVNWLAANRKWRARIQVGGEQIPLGCYANEEDAAWAYNQAAKHYFGEFARLNVIQPIDKERELCQ